MISDHLNLLLIKALSAYQKLMSNIIMTKGIFIGKYKNYSIRIFFKHLFYLAAYLYKFIYKLGFKVASR